MTGGPLKLHLGSGNKYIPGFFHLDAQQFPHVDLVGPADKLDRFADGSVALIYACHILEHFGRAEVQKVLKEWHRVLIGSGILRLAVPDYEACARLYVAGKLPGGIDDILGLMVGGQRTEYDFHKMIFDQSSLTALLKSVGFSTVRRWDWRSTEHANMDDYSQAYLPHMDKVHGTLVSLNLEAVK